GFDHDGLVAGANLDADWWTLGRVVAQSVLERDGEPMAAKSGVLGRVRQEGNAPFAERDEHRLERFAARPEPAEGRRDRGRSGLASDDPVLLELAEATSEQVAGDARQALLQIGVAASVPVQQLADDQERPAIAHDVERSRRRAVLVVGAHVKRVTV